MSPKAIKTESLETVNVSTQTAEPIQTVATEEEVRDRAHQRWVERGCPEGSPDEDWFEAENELRPQNHSS